LGYKVFGANEEKGKVYRKTGNQGEQFVTAAQRENRAAKS
jgi:hypothetical protein